MILIVITHRNLSVSNFKHGKKICEGTHEELMQNLNYINIHLPKNQILNLEELL